MRGDKQNVQAVTRALVLLETLAEDDAGWRLTDIARHTGLSPSTAHRLLTTLEERRFVQHDPRQQLWSIGRAAFSVGAAFGQRNTLIAPALPRLRELRDLTRETANFGMIDDGEIVVMAQVESRGIVRAIARTGGRTKLTGSAMGKAVLSAYSEEMSGPVLSARDAFRATASEADIRRDIAVARAQGFVVDCQQRSRGITCVASPVRNAVGDVVGAMSVSGLSARITPERLPTIGAQVARTAAEFSAALKVAASRSSQGPGRQRSSGGPAVRHSADTESVDNPLASTAR